MTAGPGCERAQIVQSSAREIYDQAPNRVGVTRVAHGRHAAGIDELGTHWRWRGRWRLAASGPGLAPYSAGNSINAIGLTARIFRQLVPGYRAAVLRKIRFTKYKLLWIDLDCLSHVFDGSILKFLRVAAWRCGAVLMSVLILTQGTPRAL